jgi:hypothetical protein
MITTSKAALYPDPPELYGIRFHFGKRDVRFGFVQELRKIVFVRTP